MKTARNPSVATSPIASNGLMACKFIVATTPTTIVTTNALLLGAALACSLSRIERKGREPLKQVEQPLDEAEKGKSVLLRSLVAVVALQLLLVVALAFV